MVPKDSPASTSGTSSMISEPAAAGNPNCAETFATLALYGDSLVPEQISGLLGLEPTEAAPRGWATTSPSGKTRLAPTGRWLLESRGQVLSTNLEDHVHWLLKRLEIAGVAPLTLAGVSRASVSCYWLSATGHGGPTFTPEVLGRLAYLQLGLDFDLYFSA